MALKWLLSHRATARQSRTKSAAISRFLENIPSQELPEKAKRTDFMAWSCSSYYDFLFDEAPHFDKDVLRDYYPTDDAWIGHVSTIPWEAFTGTTHVYEHTRIQAPDLSQAWQAFDTQDTNCVSNACTPTSITVGWGATIKTYTRARQTYSTNVLCFDQINTRAKAKEQLAIIIKGIKEITKIVWSDYIRANSMQLADTISICGSALTTVTITAATFTGNLTTITLGSDSYLPTSMLTIQYLQRFYEQLQGFGYFKSKYVPAGIMKLITDPISANQLVEQNPQLISNYKFTDFVRGGELFKYGMSKGIGNFGVSYDTFPARFYPENDGHGTLTRVWPYINQATTIGKMAVVNPYWLLAPIQYSCIWHPEAMRRAVPKLESVHPDMPFLTRDLAGKWTFTGPESDSFVVTDPITQTTCVIDNKRRNQGLFWSDFEAGFRYEYPEWKVCILHLRDPGAVTDSPPCTTAPSYVTQSYAGYNPVCTALSS